MTTPDWNKLDEERLLAFIEGDLDMADAALVQAELRRNPTAEARILAMRSDRERVRSLAMPAVPGDLLEDLELQLSRPMLIETQVPAMNGAFQRTRHLRRRRRIMQMAAAAGITLVAFGGVWATIVLSQRVLFSTDDSNLVVQGELPTDTLRSTNALGVDGSPWLPNVASAAAMKGEASLQVHHRLDIRELLRATGAQPSLAAASTADPSTRGAGTIAVSGAQSAPIMPTPSGVVLVAQASDAQAVLERMQSIVVEIDSGAEIDASLVRNFSFEEAQRLAMEWMRDRTARERDQTPLYLGLDRPAAQLAPAVARIADQAERQLRQMREANQSAPVENGQLAGRIALAPSVAQQLEYSNGGASYTISVPASQVHALLERLQRELSQQPVHLRTWMPETTRGENAAQPERSKKAPMMAIDALGWLRERPQIEAALSELRTRDPDEIVLVPIVIASPPQRR